MSNSIHSTQLPLTVALVVFSLIEQQLCILMEKQKEPPFLHGWGLVTCTVDCQQDASLEQTAKRHVKALTGVETPYLEQVQTIGNKLRDPRGWSIVVVYYSLIANEFKQATKQNTTWMPIAKALACELAFDHRQLIESCLHRFQNKSLYTSLPIFLLAPEFTLTDLQKTYELILDIKMEKKSFRRRLLDAGFLQETGQTRRANHRPATLYRLAQLQPYYFARIIEGVRDSKNMEE
ncbi:MAG: NUDIX hydrolase [Proteobacteria bacterium]|nr:NUDIX hydrolase [Pseudomonadota bacterium]